MALEQLPSNCRAHTRFELPGGALAARAFPPGPDACAGCVPEVHRPRRCTLPLERFTWWRLVRLRIIPRARKRSAEGKESPRRPNSAATTSSANAGTSHRVYPRRICGHRTTTMETGGSRGFPSSDLSPAKSCQHPDSRRRTARGCIGVPHFYYPAADRGRAPVGEAECSTGEQSVSDLRFR